MVMKISQDVKKTLRNLKNESLYDQTNYIFHKILCYKNYIWIVFLHCESLYGKTKYVSKKMTYYKSYIWTVFLQCESLCFIFLRKCLDTKITFEWFLYNVNLYMDWQITFLRKCLVTKIPFEWFFLSVTFIMDI